MSLLCLFFENFCSTKHSTYNKNSARFLSLFLTHQKLLRIVDFFLTKICRFTCQLGVQSYTKMETQNLVKILFLTQKPQKWQKWKIQFLHIVSKLTKLSAFPTKIKCQIFEISRQKWQKSNFHILILKEKFLLKNQIFAMIFKGFKRYFFAAPLEINKTN